VNGFLAKIIQKVYLLCFSPLLVGCHFRYFCLATARNDRRNLGNSTKFPLKNFSLFCRCAVPAVRRGEPARGRVRERPTSSERRSPAHRRTGAAWYQTLRHISAATSVSRMRFQNPGSIPRDRLHLAWCYRRKQASGYDAESSCIYQRTETERPWYIRLGD